MPDEHIQTPPDLTLAESAVLYLLERVRRDVDLRWLLLGTEGFSRLIAAQAQRTGQPEEEVERHYSNSDPYYQGERPKVVRARKLLERIADLAHDGGNYCGKAGEACRQIADLAEEAP